MALIDGLNDSATMEYSVTKAANGYHNWVRFKNRCMLVLEKGIDFEIDKDDRNVKIVEKKAPDN